MKNELLVQIGESTLAFRCGDVGDFYIGDKYYDDEDVINHIRVTALKPSMLYYHEIKVVSYEADERTWDSICEIESLIAKAIDPYTPDDYSIDNDYINNRLRDVL